MKSRTNVLTFRPKKVKIKLINCIGGVAVSVKLTPQHVEAIERILKQRGSPKALIEVSNGKPVIKQIEQRQIAV